jgi:hypothetical protein
MSVALFASSQVPKLNSYPSASAVIFLDFDGQTINGTSWNYNGPIYCGASGLDNTKINTIFDRVAEDYRPFNVNITTDSAVYYAAPATKRMRAVLTVTSDWYGSAGGVAFIGSFTWGDNTPCFIFTALLNYNVKNIAEAVSHEVGHTLGLYHQSTYDVNCVKTSDYNYGQGTGEIGWAPIMGVGYYQNFTLWNNGPNSFGCTSLQSDLNIITTTNGFSYRTDDHAATFAGATTTAFSSNQFTVNGIIEQSSDADLIKFNQPSGGRFQLSAVPYNVGSGNAGSDLDMQVTLYNDAQTLLNVYNPGNLLSSVIDTILSAGNYYLKVEGKGNMYAPNYASLGSYALQGTFTANDPLPLRSIELKGEKNNDKHILKWIIEADEQVTDQIIEISTDGKNFSPLNNTPAAERSFVYQPIIPGTLQYRLNVTFENGKQYYSNIITLKTGSNTNRPQLKGNVIHNSTLSVSSPSMFTYIVVDVAGKVLASGELSAGLNIINTRINTGGMYFISFSNGIDHWNDKIIYQ